MCTSEDGLKHYSLTEKIGTGSFGVVYKAVDKRTGKPVALKRISFDTRSDGTLKPTVVREITIMRELDHPNIVRLEEVIFDAVNIHLAFEFLHIDLSKYIKQLPPNLYMEKWLYQILQGICYCHQRGILHRDMKPQNLLLSTDGAIKITDFGLSRGFSVPPRAYTSNVVTPIYRAPELLLGAVQYTPGIDMWSIGCIFAEMATKVILFPGTNDINQIKIIFETLPTPTEETWRGVMELPHYQSIMYPRNQENTLERSLRPYMDSDAIAIVQLLLTYDPAKRATAKQLLKHPFYSDVDRSKLPAADYDGTLQIPPLKRITEASS